MLAKLQRQISKTPKQLKISYCRSELGISILNCANLQSALAFIPISYLDQLFYCMNIRIHEISQTSMKQKNIPT